MLRELLLRPVLNKLAELEKKMADLTPLLTTVAEGLQSMGPEVTRLVSENASLRSRNAELEGEEASESAAADNLVMRFNDLAGHLSNAEEVPSVDPVEAPPSVESGNGNGNQSPAPAGPESTGAVPQTSEPNAENSNENNDESVVDTEAAQDPNSPLS